MQRATRATPVSCAGVGSSKLGLRALQLLDSSNALYEEVGVNTERRDVGLESCCAPSRRRRRPISSSVALQRKINNSGANSWVNGINAARTKNAKPSA